MKTFELNIGDIKIIIDKYSIKVNTKQILFGDIIDFDYTHSYFNNMGGNEFILMTPQDKIHLSVTRGPFASAKKDNDIQLLENLFHELFPIIIDSYLINTWKQIQNFNEIKLANVFFTKTGIKIPSKFFTDEILIPYPDVDLISEKRNLGLLGSKGHVIFFSIVDLRSGNEYFPSKSADNQPSQGETLKAKSLLSFIKSSYHE